MFTPYRLTYLAVATVLIGAAVTLNDPEAGPKRVESGPVALEAAASAAPETSSPEGHEKGNLSEVGARELLSVTDYERAVTISKGKPVLVFKHSTECPISGAAYRRVAAWAKDKGKAAPGIFLVKVIEQQPVSQEIAARAKIQHESPQVILFVDAKPVWSASHEGITGEAIDAALLAAASRPKETG